MSKPIVATWGLGPSYRDRVKQNFEKSLSAFLVAFDCALANKPVTNMIIKIELYFFMIMYLG